MGKISQSSPARFEERARKSGVGNEQPLRREANEQAQKGEASPPFPLTLDESPPKLARHLMNIASRFGAEQGAKLRACDDLRHAKTNLAFVVATPTKLVRWDHMAQLSNLANANGGIGPSSKLITKPRTISSQSKPNMLSWP